MTLKEFRIKFRDFSGRYDLVGEDGSDNGADFFIQSGQKLLDRLLTHNQSFMSFFFPLEATLSGVELSGCRAVKEVWAADTSSRWQLQKRPMGEFVRSNTYGAPLYYALTLKRYFPNGVFDTPTVWADVPASVADAIVVWPQSSQDLTIEVRGLFYEPLPREDGDTNFWLTEYPFILLLSTMRQLEIVNRNSQGVRDWEMALEKELVTLEFDMLEGDIAAIDQMEG